LNRLQAGITILLLSVIIFSGCRTAGTVSAGEAAEAWFNLGNAYTELGRHDDAVKAFLKAQRLDPQLVSAGFNLARVQILQKKYDDSLGQLDKLLETDPGNRLLLETKAWVFHLKDENAAALEIYNMVLSDFEDSRNSLYNSALILVELEQYKTALERFKRLVELYEDETSSIFEIAKLEAALGNSKDSILWLVKHLADNPDDFEALELAGDMYTVERRYAEAVASYRIITKSAAEEGTPAAVEPQHSAPPDMTGRVNFKIAEILLIYLEDLSGGLSALQVSVNSGWKDQDAWDRLLLNETAVWIDDVRGILKTDEDAPAEENPAAGTE